MHRPVQDDVEVNFLFNASGRVATFRMSRPAFECIRLFDGQSSKSEIAALARLDLAEVEAVVGFLSDKKILEVAREMDATNTSQKFKSQLNFFADFEGGASRYDMQQSLRDAVVTVIGVGGIGTWIVKSLALAGVGRLRVIDPDIVEASNLTRQCLYTENDVGTPKVDAVEKSCSELTSESAIERVREKLESSSLLELCAADSSLIVNCADSPSTDITNKIVTEFGFEADIPHILCGGYDGHVGFVGPTVVPGLSACWDCYLRSLSEQLNASRYEQIFITEAHAAGGTIAPVGAIIGNLHALEALKVLSGFAEASMLNRALEIDFASLQVTERKFTTHAQCPRCEVQ